MAMDRTQVNGGVVRSDGASSMQVELQGARAVFHEKFQNTRAYVLLTPIEKYQPGRLERLERACWLWRCAATRKALRGPQAKRALSLLARHKWCLREPSWLPEGLPAGLDKLQSDLTILASLGGKDRPRDTLGRSFRRNTGIFFTHGALIGGKYREFTQAEIDELLSELFFLATGRVLSLESYVRMRKRDKAEETQSTFGPREKAKESRSAAEL